MNALFLEDLLMVHPDRHGGNFKIEAKDGKVLGVKGIDNDSAFGERTDINTMFNENGGLPEQMHIDRAMADKIRSVKPEQLDLVFSDLLTKAEIDAMKSRFATMSKYIDEMEKQNMLVDQWNEETARQQLMQAKGIRYSATEKGGNSYYQGMLLRMNNKLKDRDTGYR
ncbi:MAG: hypothetical protein IJU66_08535 [Oscillospiraceae bacterium]|nr:hypothetical protein [Oscillospiraceae bacterium]